MDHGPHLLTLGLNHPRAINALTFNLIRDLQLALDEAEDEGRIKLVLLLGEGERGFCAGGDLRALAETVREGAFDRADRFFQQEYALDLRIHRFPKPIMVLADGITMGGGLGWPPGPARSLPRKRPGWPCRKPRSVFSPMWGPVAGYLTDVPGGIRNFWG